MWPKSYKDYKEDECLVKEKVYPGKGIIGSEMHDINGFGNTHHRPKKSKNPSFIRTLLNAVFKKFS